MLIESSRSSGGVVVPAGALFSTLLSLFPSTSLLLHFWVLFFALPSSDFLLTVSYSASLVFVSRTLLRKGKRSESTLPRLEGPGWQETACNRWKQNSQLKKKKIKGSKPSNDSQAHPLVLKVW